MGGGGGGGGGGKTIAVRVCVLSDFISSKRISAGARKSRGATCLQCWDLH